MSDGQQLAIEIYTTINTANIIEQERLDKLSIATTHQRSLGGIMLTVANLLEKGPCPIHSIVTTLCTFLLDFRQKEELIKELVKSDKEAKEMKKQYSEKIKSMKQELEKAKRELEESKKTLEGCESKANYEVSEKQKVESEYKKKLQTVEGKLQALRRKQKVRSPWVLFFKRLKLLSMHV